MWAKLFLTQIICLIFLLNRLSVCQPLSSKEEEAVEEEHLNIRLKHYLKRLELMPENINNKFSAELKDLKDKFKHSLEKESLKEKTFFLDKFDQYMEFSEFLSLEFDKQYLDEDILMESWYLNEIIPYVDGDIKAEAIQIVKDLKVAYHTEDLDKKYDIYADIGEKMSEKFLDYFYGENESLPLLNAHLKYYMEYLNYLLEEDKLDGEFKKKLQDLMVNVETARASVNKEVKEKVIDLFDDLTTRFGRYLDEHFSDFKMFKFYQ